MIRWRGLLLGAVIWVAGYLAAYLIIMSQQGDFAPAWWYVALLVVAAGLLCSVVSGWSGRRALVSATGLLGFATVIGVLSIGVFLLPALIAAVMAVSMSDVPTRPRSGPRPRGGVSS